VISGNNPNATGNSTLAVETGSTASGNAGIQNAGKDGSTSTSIDPTTQKYFQLKDTSLKGVLSYLDKNAIVLKSTEANTMKENAVKSLKNLAEEQLQIENAANTTNGNSGKMSAADTRNEIAKKLGDADNSAKTASEIRKEANTKTGPDKDNLLSQAREADKKGTDARLEAAALQNQLNEAQYKSNSDALAKLVEKAKGQAEADQANQLLASVATLKKQANDLRNEANALPSGAARLGGLSNAEEKEAEMLSKQQQAIDLLKKYSPEDVPAEVAIVAITGGNIQGKAQLNALTEKQISEHEKIRNLAVKLYQKI
jgi:hypothetical protein